jgi:hypothetical protein
LIVEEDDDENMENEINELIIWLEANTSNCEERQKIINNLYAALEIERITQQKGELYIVSMSKEKYKEYLKI